LNFPVPRTYRQVPLSVDEPSFFACDVPSKRTMVLSPLSKTLVLYPCALPVEPVMSAMDASMVRPGLLPLIVKGVVQVQSALWNAIVSAPAPPASLTLGFEQVSLPVILVCAPAVIAIPQSSAGTKMTFRITISGEGEWGLSDLLPAPPNSAHTLERSARRPGRRHSDLS
jgi:hypothetical protein